MYWWGLGLRCTQCGRELWSPLKAIREIHGHYVLFAESKDPNRILQRRRLYVLEADPLIGRGWRKEGGKRSPMVVVAEKKCQLVGKGGDL
jgi:hypothetical protein